MERLGGFAEKVRARTDADFFGLDHLSDVELEQLLGKADSTELRNPQHHAAGLINLGHTLLDSLAGAVATGFVAGLSLLDALPSLLLCLATLDRQAYQEFRLQAVDFLLTSLSWRLGLAQLMATLLDVEVTGAEEDRLTELCGRLLPDLPPADLCATLRQLLAWSEHSPQERWIQLAYLLLTQGQADQDSLGFVLELALRHSTRLAERLLGIVSDGHQLSATDVQVLLCLEAIEPLRGTAMEYLTALAVSHPNVFLQLILNTVERQGERRAPLLVDLAVSVLERSGQAGDVAHQLLLQIYERLSPSRPQLLSLVLRKIAEYHLDPPHVQPFLGLLRQLIERFPADIQPHTQNLTSFLSHLLDLSLDCAKAYLDAISTLLTTSRALVDALFVSTRKWLQQWAEDRKALGCHAAALLLMKSMAGTFDWELVKPILAYPLFSRSMFLESLNQHATELDPSRASKLLELLLPRLTRFFVPSPSPTLSMGKLFDENGNPRENLGLVLSLLFQLLDLCQGSVERELARSVIGVFAKALFPKDLASVHIPEHQFDTILAEALPITSENRISSQVRSRLLCQAFLVFAERMGKVTTLFNLNPAALIDSFKGFVSVKLESSSVPTICYLLDLSLSPLNPVTATHLLAALETLLGRLQPELGSERATALSLLLRLHDHTRPLPDLDRPGFTSEDQYHNLSAKLLRCISLICCSADCPRRGNHPDLDSWLAKLPAIVRTEIDFGVMASTLTNYLSIASALLEATERPHFAAMITEVLTSYRIGQAPIVRVFTDFLLSAEPAASVFTLSQSILGRVLAPEDDGPCFAATPICADAALASLLRYLAAHHAARPELMTFLEALVHSPALSARMSVALCLAAGRAARHHTRLLTGSGEVAPAVLEKLAAFADGLLAWCNRSRCAKTPDLVFKLEQLELLIKRRCRALDEGFYLLTRPGDAKCVTSALTQSGRPRPEIQRTTKQAKGRLRSRNAFIDAALKEQTGGDDFADLEDFIVCKKGKSYA